MSDEPLHPTKKQLWSKIQEAQAAASIYKPAAPVIYRPNAPTAPPYYATWAEAWAVASAPGGPVLIEIDGAAMPAPPPGTPIVVPGPLPGTYDFQGGGLTGTFYTSEQTALPLGEGVFFDHFYTIADNLALVSQATSTIAITLDNADVFLVERGASLATKDGSSPLIQIAAPGGGSVVALDLGGAIGTLPGSGYNGPVATVDAGSQFLIGALQLSNVYNNVAVGLGTLVLLVGTVSATFEIPPSQLAASINVQNLTGGMFGNKMSGFSESLGDLSNPTRVPGGYSLATTASDARTSAGLSGLLSQLEVSHSGDAANAAGQRVVYSALVNGVVVPGASVSLDASVNDSATVQFFSGYNAGDHISIQAGPTAPLTATVTDITTSLV